MSTDRERLAELQQTWNARFIQQPKLPTSALLTGAVSMALAFGFVLFILSAPMRRYAWIWLALSLALGGINRMLARRWYRKVVVPWDHDRRATAAEMNDLQKRLPPS